MSNPIAPAVDAELRRILRIANWFFLGASKRYLAKRDEPDHDEVLDLIKAGRFQEASRLYQNSEAYNDTPGGIRHNRELLRYLMEQGTLSSVSVRYPDEQVYRYDSTHFPGKQSHDALYAATKVMKVLPELTRGGRYNIECVLIPQNPA
jgi:hypothetical protein